MSKADSLKDCFNLEEQNRANVVVSAIKNEISIEETTKQIEEQAQNLQKQKKIQKKLSRLHSDEKEMYYSIIKRDKLSLEHLEFWLRVGMPMDCIKDVIELCSTEKFEEIRPYIEKAIKDNPVEKPFSYSFAVSVVVRACNLPKEQLDFMTSNGFSGGQMEEIRLGIVHGIGMEKVRIYAKPEYSKRIMYIIRTALENHFTQEQIDFLLSAKDVNMMEEYFYAFKNGLSIDKAKKMEYLFKLVDYTDREKYDAISKVCEK